MKIKIKKLYPDVILPSYAYPGDAGLDLYSHEDFDLEPGKNKIFGLGLALEFDSGFVGLLKDRSSLSTKCVHCLGGVLDSKYRGEYKLNLINLGKEIYKIKKGDKIAQLLIMPIKQVELSEVLELKITDRGEGGFGSSGR